MYTPSLKINPGLTLTPKPNLNNSHAPAALLEVLGGRTPNGSLKTVYMHHQL